MNFLVRSLQDCAQEARKQAEREDVYLKQRRLIALAETLEGQARSLPKETS